MKQEIILILLVGIALIVFMPSVYSGYNCYKVGFCSGRYNISCNAISDGYCPENYSSWGACNGNPYGTKCFPCDPDCTNSTHPCGNITINMDNNAQPGSNIPVQVIMYKGEPAIFFVYIYNLSNYQLSYGLCINNVNSYSYILPSTGVNCTCLNSTHLCTTYFNNMPIYANTGGTLYGFIARTNITTYSISETGVTKPFIQIQNPIEGSKQNDEFTIRAKASSLFDSSQSQYNPSNPGHNQGISGNAVFNTGQVIRIITGRDTDPIIIDTGYTNITSMNISLYKEWESGSGVYKAANVTNCKTTDCTTRGCNMIAGWPGDIHREEDIFTYDWNSSICDNKNFTISITVYDDLSQNTDSVIFYLNNTNGCIENCGSTSTSILNLVISKIKVWL